MRFLLVGQKRQPVGGVAVDEDCLPDGELDDTEQRVEHVVDDLARLVPPGLNKIIVIWQSFSTCLVRKVGQTSQDGRGRSARIQSSQR